MRVMRDNSTIACLEEVGFVRLKLWRGVIIGFSAWWDKNMRLEIIQSRRNWSRGVVLEWGRRILDTAAGPSLRAMLLEAVGFILPVVGNDHGGCGDALGCAHKVPERVAYSTGSKRLYLGEILNESSDA
jgi:hypothetical protein